MYGLLGAREMDPNENIREQLQLARRFVLMEERSKDTVIYDESEVCRLAELVIALDEWQRKGGFSPYATQETKS
jgi:hypothetical protein